MIPSHDEKKVPHVPVLLEEVLKIFSTMPSSGVFIDCTVGYGGHSEAILKRFDNVRLVGIDQDPEAVAFSRRRLAPYKNRVEIVRGRFSQLLPQLLEKEPVCGVLADFGVSSLQLDKKERGFSFLSDNLDMRMDPEAPLDAWQVVNRYSQEELERIFRDYGEHKRWRQAAAAVVKARQRKPIESGIELAEILAPAVGRTKGKTHPATSLFQAIRIEVNDELGEIERMLDALQRHPPYGAVVGLITFHSLEDRLVKNRFKRWSRACICPPESFRCSCGADHALGEPIVKKPLTVSRQEQRQNPRSRSAKLRGFKFKEK